MVVRFPCWNRHLRQRSLSERVLDSECCRVSAIVRRVNWGPKRNLDVPSCQVLSSVSAWCRIYDLELAEGSRGWWERSLCDRHLNSATDQMHRRETRRVLTWLFGMWLFLYHLGLTLLLLAPALQMQVTRKCVISEYAGAISGWETRILLRCQQLNVERPLEEVNLGNTEFQRLLLALLCLWALGSELIWQLNYSGWKKTQPSSSLFILPSIAFYCLCPFLGCNVKIYSNTHSPPFWLLFCFANFLWRHFPHKNWT